MLRYGNIEPVLHHDFAITMQEKQRGSFLMCANRATTDIEIEANVTQGPEDIPVQDIETKVKGVEKLDSQIIKLHLQTPRSQRLRFIAGQSVLLSIDDLQDGTHAVASCPCDDRNLLFHIPYVPGDEFSEFVFSGHLGPRDKVRLRGPQRGSFFLDSDVKKRSLILCWHTGFAPIISLMEHAMALEIEEEIYLYRLSPTPDQQYLSNLCRSWSDAFDNINVELLPVRFTLLSSKEDSKEIIANIAAQHPDIRDYSIYVAGPPNLIEAAQNVFADSGLSDHQIKTHTESFGLFD
jgi:CDP-4-dehydro-6-deoxyglucose reductase